MGSIVSYLPLFNEVIGESWLQLFFVNDPFRLIDLCREALSLSSPVSVPSAQSLLPIHYQLLNPFTAAMRNSHCIML